MQTLRWRCVNSKGFVEDAISFVSRGVVCHVEFLIDGKAIGAHAAGGVQVRQIDHYEADYRFKADCTDEQYAAGLKFLMDQVGKPYDFLDIVGIMASRNWHDDSRWICSELWAAVMEAAGLIHPIEGGISLVTPQDTLILSSAMFEREYITD